VKKALVQLSEGAFAVHFSDASFAALRKNCELLSNKPVADLSSSGVEALLGETEILITGWGSSPVDAEVRARMPKLGLVAHLGGTVKPIISRDVIGSGLQVTQASDANARPVAEFTLATILHFNKRVSDWERLYRAKRSALFTRREPLHALVGNRDRVVGVVGASRVGRLVIAHLRHHGMRILLSDPFASASEARELGAEHVDLDTLLARSDVITLHQPLLPSTEKSIGARELGLMRDGALIINTARGKVVDHEALIAELGSGRIHAALDVTDPEPLPDNSPLWDMPNVSLTPHVAGAMGREVDDMTHLIIEEIGRFGEGLPLRHAVSPYDWERAA
jgi:phosphoglycerate dehydrogenase-like enzyme